MASSGACVRGRAPRRSSSSGQALTRRVAGGPGSGAVRLHEASVASAAKDNPVPTHDPFGARGPLGAGLPDRYRLAALGDRIDLGPGPRHPQDPARERPPPRRRRHRPAEDVETLAVLAARGRRRGRDPVHARRGSSSRTSPASPRSSTWPRCATRWPTSAAIPARVNPLVPADLVIDHSVQVDAFGTPAAFAFNVDREYERNGERYQLLRWAQTRLPRPARRAARHGHRPPGQPGVPRHRRRRPRRRPTAGSPSRTRSSGPTPTRR